MFQHLKKRSYCSTKPYIVYETLMQQNCSTNTKKQKGEKKCKTWLKSFDYPYTDRKEPQCNTNVQ
jgi:hypothetical protein